MRKRIPTFSVTGLFGSGDTEILALTYDAYNLDQKVTRLMGPHSMKFGFRWAREIGFKSNPQTNRFTFPSLDDLLANKASDFLLAMGNPPHHAWVDQFGGFIQDDWRVTDRFVLNLGLRYDYYPGVWLQVHSIRRSGGGQQPEQSDRHPQDGFRRAARSARCRSTTTS